MRNSKLTFLCAVFGPLLMATMACFLTTGPDEYEETYGTGGGGCAVGAPGCPCTGSGACDEGLTCVGMLNVCIVDIDCTGAPGCNCTPQGEACDAGYICREGYCVGNQPCLEANIGSEGCQCTVGGGCDGELACLSEICVDPGDGTTSTTTTGDASTSTTTMTTETATTDESDTAETSSGSSSSSSTGSSVDESSGTVGASAGASATEGA